MKLWIIFLCLTAYQWTATAQAPISVIAKLDGCRSPEQVKLYQFEGFSFEVVQPPIDTAHQHYHFELPRQGNALYHIGDPATAYKPMVFGAEDSVVIQGPCSNVNQWKIYSPINDAYNEVKKQMQFLHRQSVSSLSRYLMAVRSSDSTQALAQLNQLRTLNTQKLHLVQSLQSTQPYLARTASLLAWQVPLPQEGLLVDSMVLKVATGFYDGVDFTHSDYNGIAYVYESFRQYAELFLNAQMPNEVLAALFELQLSKMPSGSRAERYAYAGVLAALLKKKNPLYASFAEQLLERYPRMPGHLNLRNTLEAFMVTMPGSLAPDIEMVNPEGDTLRLSDLRGQVVLLDFWASWCGPCRRENPHVVKMYQTYQDRGFTVFSVSLDKKKSSWITAIEKDRLEWSHHVSDLKGWKNQAAKKYHVSSIPHTVLIDREGRIIAHKLRGAALESTLKTIFEED